MTEEEGSDAAEEEQDGFHESYSEGEEEGEDIALRLQGRIDECENEIRVLRAQIRSQQVLLDHFQADALLSMERLTLSPSSSSMMAATMLPEHPLLIAADTGNVDMARLLLDTGGADPCCHNNAAILLASQGGHVDLVRLLLDRGADLHVEYDSPLQWAVQRGDVGLVRLLLERGATPDALNGCPLRLATRMGHVEVAELLLRASPPHVVTKYTRYVQNRVDHIRCLCQALIRPSRWARRPTSSACHDRCRCLRCNAGQDLLGGAHGIPGHLELQRASGIRKQRVHSVLSLLFQQQPSHVRDPRVQRHVACFGRRSVGGGGQHLIQLLKNRRRMDISPRCAWQACGLISTPRRSRRGPRWRAPRRTAACSWPCCPATLGTCAA